MGKGDRRTRRGKISAGTYGNSRPKRRKRQVRKPEAPVQAKD